MEFLDLSGVILRTFTPTVGPTRRTALTTRCLGFFFFFVVVIFIQKTFHSNRSIRLSPRGQRHQLRDIVHTVVL